MAGKYSYPGVYVEEVPSGVRTIAEVSTSDTAFIGYFPRGSTDGPMRLTSFADFEREFGGLDLESETSYAIWQYFLNGGSVAWVVRAVASNAVTARTTLKGGSYGSQNVFDVLAASPGEWGNNVQVAVDHNVSASRAGEAFNLVAREVREVNGKTEVVATEVYRNLNMNTSSTLYGPSAVNSSSGLIRLDDISGGELPAATGADVINDPADEDFVTLGVSGDGLAGDEFEAGANGFAPGSDDWINSEGGTALLGSPDDKSGLYALEKIAPYIFNILCIPDAVGLSAEAMQNVYSEATTYCRDKRAFLIVDIPPTGARNVASWTSANLASVDSLRDDHAAVYFPRVEIADPLDDFRRRDIPSSGTLAGIYARTDASRGVWKAPAGVDANLRSAQVALEMNDLENGQLNQMGINALRLFPIYGNVSWGARTMDGSDMEASEWKYIPVRRTALFIEESLYQGLKWVVFEPNDEKLWGQIRLNVGAFMNNLFRRGAFQGTSAREAYFVKCDSETTTQNDINNGIVNIWVGFAPLKPAEFVVIKLQQMAGQIEV
jgi:phage tail sheath protein FI